MRFSTFIVAFLLLTTVPHSWATHNRAGEITIKQTGNLSINITITTFTYTLSSADRDSLLVDWGDNTYSWARRKEILMLPGYYQRNIYTADHVFSIYGVYEILVQDPNRNLGVKNIPNSVNVIFSIKTTVILSASVGHNNNPVLLNYPIDKAGLNQVFVHNPAAYDADGDSLSYSLTTCTGEDGVPIENYSLPKASDTLYVDVVSGDLVWDSPMETGIYNVAINIEEWRRGLKIANIVRDMQIEVVETDNQLPEIDSLPDICLLAGDTARFTVSAFDPDADPLVLYASGGVFELVESPASFTEHTGESAGTAKGDFLWATACTHVRNAPYQVVFKAEDTHGTFKGVTFRSLNIRVLGKRVEDFRADPGSESISLSWAPYYCNDIVRFDIYRKEGFSDYVPGACDNSIPEGFIRIGQTASDSTFYYEDFREAGGLVQGVAYCYIVVAVFDNGTFETLSIPSEVVCGTLIQGTPTLVQVSVVRHDAATGAIRLAWIPPSPSVLDTLNGGAPFYYYLYRAIPSNLSELQLIDNTKTNLTDTIFVDGGINTTQYPFKYKIELFYTDSLTGELRYAGGGSTAFSTYLEARPGDNQIILKTIKNAPWVNIVDSIFVQLPGQSGYTLAGVVARTDSFVHTNLINGQEYVYEVHSIGMYAADTATYVTHNITHRVIATPVDTVAPCPPVLSVTSLCDSLVNLLNWTNPNSTCADDVTGYRLYWSRSTGGTTSHFYEIYNPSDTVFSHVLNSGLGACYEVTAVDSFGNESAKSNRVCVDVCRLFCIPPYFSPDGDYINEQLLSCGTEEYLAGIEVDFEIYSRWGMLVYKTSDPRIAWDGRDRISHNLVSTGVYYYICNVKEPRISGMEEYTLTGFVHVFYGKNSQYAP